MRDKPQSHFRVALAIAIILTLALWIVIGALTFNMPMTRTLPLAG